MNLRRGPLYTGVFLLGAGAVTLGVAAGVLDRSAVAGTAFALWPIAVIAIGAWLVLRRSPAALAAGIAAAAIPGVALAASLVSVPDLATPCSNAGTSTGPAVTRDGSFGTTGRVTLDLSCGALAVTTQPGSAWHVESRDGTNRRTDVVDGPGSLSVDTDGDRHRISFGDGRVDLAVALPTDPSIDLSTTVNAGSGRLDLGGAHLGRLGLGVNAGTLHATLAGATVDRLSVNVNAGSASLTLPAASFTGDLEANAGSLDVCVPDGLGLRLRTTAALGSVHANGFVRSGNALESPDYATAPFKADLAIDASVGSVTINPEGGCQ